MTAEQLQDALGLLPSDLIQDADAWRCGNRKKVIHWRRYAALAACLILVLGSGAFFLSQGRGGSMEKITMQESKADQAAPQAPAAMAPEEAPAAAEPESAVGEEVANSLIRDEAEEADTTCSTPPVDTGAAQFYFGELSAADEVRLITDAAGLEGLGLDTYDEAWFRECDLLLIALPGITSPEGLEFSVGQGADPLHWEIRIENLPELQADCADSLLICIPVQKGHIPRDAEFTLIPQ